jgi:hypothetical protein
MSRLRLTKSFLVSFALREVPIMKFSSSEDEEMSIIGIFSEALPCSNTGEQGWCDKRGKNHKASKKEECEMIISVRWRVNL